MLAKSEYIPGNTWIQARSGRMDMAIREGETTFHGQAGRFCARQLANREGPSSSAWAGGKHSAARAA
eukprot:5374008-Pyramimonas_sp.AAC.1